MSGSTEEATINPDGSTSFTEDATDAGFDKEGEESGAEGAEDAAAETVRKGTDPAIYLALAFIGAIIIYYFYYTRNKKKQSEQESFFFEMDGDKVGLWWFCNSPMIGHHEIV